MESLTIINVILIFILAFAVSSICIPLVIKIAIKRRLFDAGGGRHVHKGFVPRLGGMALFVGFIFSQVYFAIDFFSISSISSTYLLLVFSITLMFVLGLIDDLVNVNANIKFVVQLLVAIILVWRTDVRILSFNGLLGIDELPLVASYIYSIVLVVFLINAFNLIDGLDSLSATLGICVFSGFLYLFVLNEMHVETFLCVSAIGALLGFWFYNKPPARIFMGDSGTLFIGLLLAYCAVRVSNIGLDSIGTVNPVIAMSVLVYPAIDTLRVFTNRIMTGRSPFSPDRNHIHHLLFDLGLGHGWVTIIIVSTSVFITSTVYCFREYVTLSFFVALTLTIITSQLPAYLLNRKRKHAKFR
jgi:UDP-N-acetylmuramyl pentapeptide phosphotransferase/UDP-N-acetylglucosamine-1-phosphate transferase